MFLDLYKKASRSEYEQLAFNYLVKDILGDKLTGYDKVKEFPGFNMEEAMPLQILPTMIYTFMYNTGQKESIGGLQYTDAVPVILCIKRAGDDITGINFNFLPGGVRASILDIIYNSDENYYKTAKTDVFSINKSLTSVLIAPDGPEKFVKFLEIKTGLQIGNAVRHYMKPKMKNIRMVEYDMWKYIPFLVFKDAIRGAGLASVQATILKKN